MPSRWLNSGTISGGQLHLIVCKHLPQSQFDSIFDNADISFRHTEEIPIEQCLETDSRASLFGPEEDSISFAFPQANISDLQATTEVLLSIKSKYFANSDNRIQRARYSTLRDQGFRGDAVSLAGTGNWPDRYYTRVTITCERLDDLINITTLPLIDIGDSELTRIGANRIASERAKARKAEKKALLIVDPATQTTGTNMPSRNERPAILSLIEQHIEMYPEDIFLPGSKSPDGIAADAIRWKLRQLRDEVRAGKHLETGS